MAFLLDGDRFAAANDELARKGVEVQGPEDTGIAYSSFFTDPDGHLLEITAYHGAAAPVPPTAAAVPAGSHAS